MKTLLEETLGLMPGRARSHWSLQEQDYSDALAQAHQKAAEAMKSVLGGRSKYDASKNFWSSFVDTEIRGERIYLEVGGNYLPSPEVYYIYFKVNGPMGRLSKGQRDLMKRSMGEMQHFVKRLRKYGDVTPLVLQGGMAVGGVEVPEEKMPSFLKELPRMARQWAALFQKVLEGLEVGSDEEVLDEGLTGPTRMQVQDFVDKQMKAGKSARQAAMAAEKAFKLKTVELNSKNQVAFMEGKPAWVGAAKELLKKRTGKSQGDLHYRAYLRAVIDGDQAQMKHLRSKFPEAKKAAQDLIDRAGMGEGAPGPFAVSDNPPTIQDMVDAVREQIKAPSWTYPNWALPKVQLDEGLSSAERKVLSSIARNDMLPMSALRGKDSELKALTDRGLVRWDLGVKGYAVTSKGRDALA